MIWAATSTNVKAISAVDGALARHFFGTAPAIVTGYNATVNPIPATYSCRAALIFPALAGFQAAAAISGAYTYAMYDPEAWPATPPAEQQNPKGYLRQFGQYGHSRRLRTIGAPDRSLAKTDTADPLLNETWDQWYLRTGVAGSTAMHNDVLVVQAQYHTPVPADYAALVAPAQRQAQTANPFVSVLAELSTASGTAAQMFAAAQSVTPDGFYLSVPTPVGVPAAVDFLRQMRAAGR